jgi:hypothetical protein
MPTTDYATGIASPDLRTDDSEMEAPPRPYAGAPKPLRGLLFGFTATVTIGLALASWYVGVRISLAPTPGSTSVPLPSPPAASAPQDSMAQAYWYKVPPPSLYLQVGGLGPRQDAGFVQSLQAQGFRAQIQMSSKDDNRRILIGPYSTRAVLQQDQRKLQSAGVPAVETAY